MLKATDMIVVSTMNKYTGLYTNILVTNRPRWQKDKIHLVSYEIFNIEIFHIGEPGCDKRYYLLEDFEENEINI